MNVLNFCVGLVGTLAFFFVAFGYSKLGEMKDGKAFNRFLAVAGAIVCGVMTLVAAAAPANFNVGNLALVGAASALFGAVLVYSTRWIKSGDGAISVEIAGGFVLSCGAIAAMVFSIA